MPDAASKKPTSVLADPDRKRWANPFFSNTGFYVICGLLITLGININLLPVPASENLTGFTAELSRLFSSFPKGNDSFVFLLSWFGSFLLLRLGSRDAKHHTLSIILGAWFGFSKVFGYSLEQTGDISMLFQGFSQIVKTLASFSSWSVLFVFGLKTLFTLLDKIINSNKVDSLQVPAAVCFAIDKHPFSGPAAILFVAWLPTIIGYLPGLFMGDTYYQIMMLTNTDNLASRLVDLVDDSVLITSHYPVLHTLMIGACIQLGSMVFGDVNAGVFAYVVIQVLIVLISIAYAHVLLKKIGVPTVVRLLILALLALVPWYPGYAVLLSREALFSSGVLVAGLQIAFLLKCGTTHKRDWAILAIASVVFCLLRSGALLFSAAALASAALFAAKNKGHDRALSRGFAACLALLVVIYGGFVYVLYPCLHITHGNNMEALSIPFQQTARYVRDHPNEITLEERDAINAVLVFDDLGNQYNPSRSDPVKNPAQEFRHGISAEEWSAYFKTWFSMGLKDPLCYVTATMNNYYGYFYVSESPNVFYGYSWSEHQMQLTNEDAHTDFHMANNPAIRFIAEVNTAYTEPFKTAGPLSLLMNSAWWCWVLLVATALAIRRKHVISTPALLSLWLIMLVFLTGPMNGSIYNRYVFPLAFALPFIVAVILFERNTTYSPHVN